MSFLSSCARVGFAALRGLSLGALAGLWLTLCLSLIRLIHLWYYWPSGDAAVGAELHKALWMGLRFDLKVCAIAALLLWPVLSLPRLARRGLMLWGGLYILLALVNFYYYGFYKTPIDSVVFGVMDDDTQAIFKTIWLDFPIAQIAVFLVLAQTVAVGGMWRLARRWDAVWQSLSPRPRVLWALPVLLLAVLVAGKGTLKGMALQPNHLTVTTKAFLNDAVPNGVTALHNAWFAYSESSDVGHANTGLLHHGFASPQDAARALGWPDDAEDDIARRLRAAGVNRPTGQHLVFFQMESWGAEPLRYQAPHLDVLGSLQPQLASATLFHNFDAAHVGTHPSLEAILFGTPVTPISTGRYRDVVFDWGLASVFKQAGYDTLFVTSGESGWRELNRVLVRQGFDEVVDAATLRQRYPGAQGGIWGVWDAYMTRYILERLQAQPAGRPLFVYAMTTTNHPPYEIPADEPRAVFDMTRWPGEKSSESLEANLHSFRYANEVLARFVGDVQRGPLGARTVIAATGDHNSRTMGVYAEPERQVMRQQVPFVVWGAPTLACPSQAHAPASHLDMFPSLFPMLGIHAGYLQTGRNLWDCQTQDPLAVTFVQQVRAGDAMWQLGRVDTQACQPTGSACAWRPQQDLQARARVALLDWNIRRKVLQATAK